MNQQDWEKKSQEILTDIREWRQAHPRATFVEIENEVHRRMMQLEAQVVQDAAQASASRAWGRTQEQASPQCPRCSVPLQARGKRQRTLQGNGGSSVTLTRTRCAPARSGGKFFPLWMKNSVYFLGRWPHSNTSIWCTWRLGCPLLVPLRCSNGRWRVQVSEETVRRCAEGAGSHMQAAQTEQAQAPWQEERANKQESARLALSADGALIPLLKGEWGEVRTLAIGTINEASGDEGADEQKVQHLSYFSRFSSAETFTDLAEVEMRRRKVVQREQVCAASSGAEWLQTFFDVHRPDAVRILDFPHAAKHLTTLLEAIEKAGYPVPRGMSARCLRILKQRGPHLLLSLAARLPQVVAQLPGVREHLGYFQKREAMMQYPSFRQQGWPIGSGMVESANKLVVQARLKGAGMQWHRHNVNALLADAAMPSALASRS